MPSAARQSVEVLPRSFRSTERHPFVASLRQIAVQRAKEVEMIAAQIAVLLHNVPEEDAEITRWVGAIDRGCVELGLAIGRERMLRETEGVA